MKNTDTEIGQLAKLAGDCRYVSALNKAVSILHRHLGPVMNGMDVASLKALSAAANEINDLADEVMPAIESEKIGRRLNLVDPDMACPHCGEREQDRLVHQVDVDGIWCERCKNCYAIYHTQDGRPVTVPIGDCDDDSDDNDRMAREAAGYDN